MDFNSKKKALIILGITALVCSRVMFLFFNDPEGPNLLVVVVMAVVIYSLSLAGEHLFNRSAIGSRKLFEGICIQVILTIGLFFLLNYGPF